MDTCKLCAGEFTNSPDNLILCEHHSGIVHRGCCTDNCSWDGNPCKHCIKEYKVMGE